MIRSLKTGRLILLMGIVTTASADKVQRGTSYWKKNVKLMHKAQKVVYKHFDNHLLKGKKASFDLKLYCFFPNRKKLTKPVPVVVHFHGGSFKVGSPRKFIIQSAYWAQRGLVGISAQYRLGRPHGVSPRECVMDAKSAIRFIRSKASEWNIDPEKIIVCGGSAGGHLALATAILTDINDPRDDLKISAEPNAICVSYPVVDFSTFKLARKILGKSWREVSLQQQIKTMNVPVQILHGEKDHIHRPVAMKNFCKKLKEAGSPCELEIYAGQKHGFNGVEAAPGNNGKYFFDTLLKQEKFLAAHKLIDKPADLDEIQNIIDGL